MMTKDKLIENLIKDGYLKTPSIIEAFQKVDRADFVPENLKSEAYENYPLPIGFGQTISQPLTVAFMLELLEPKAGEKILDVGAGSGWQTALLSYIVSGKQFQEVRPSRGLTSQILTSMRKEVEPRKIDQFNTFIIAIERIHQLKEIAEKNLEKYGLISNGVVKIIEGDGTKGYEKEAPFDKIIAAAGGTKLPEAWKTQLKIGGRIVMPIRESIYVFDKKNRDTFEKRQYFGFSFVPLVTD